jgi:hypothetical protein
MAKSREDVLKSLRDIFNGKTTESEAPATVKVTAGVAADVEAFESLRKRRQTEEVAEEIEDEPAALQHHPWRDDEDDDEEEEESEEIEDTEDGDESDDVEDVESSPAEELLDRVEALIDYIVENGEALKSWLAAVR